MYDYERFGTPERAGNHYFYTRNDGLQNQSVLFVRDGLNGAPRMLIDPNTWSADGATALAEWDPSKDGRYLLYSVQDGGTDWRTVRVLDVATGQPTQDEVSWVKFSNLDWARDGSGFFYSRFPEPAEGQQFQSTNENQAVYFHRLGTPQSEDRLVYATPDRAPLGHTGEVSDDGRWLIVYSTEGTDARYEINLVDLVQPDAAPRRIVSGFENDWTYLGNSGATFYWQTNKDAPRQRIVAMNIDQPAELREIVAAGRGDPGRRLDRRPQHHRLLSGRRQERGQDLRPRRPPHRHRRAARHRRGQRLRRRHGEQRDLLCFASFNRPGAIYRYDSNTGESSVFAEPELAFDPERFEVRQVFYNSKDGTRVPMFLIHRRGLDTSRPQPTVLYGYGGFNLPELPRFQPRWMTWVDMGGVLAVANLRGGGEYGEAWHDAGRRTHKQNVFDDFIAAAEYLIAQNVTDCQPSRHRGAVERRPAGRRRPQPAAGPVRGGAADGGRDGHAALRPLHRRPLLGRRLRLSRPRGGFPHPPGLFALSQHPHGRALSGDPGDHRRHRRPRRAGAQLQVYRGAAGGRYRAGPAPHPHRDPRRPRLGQADRQADRGIFGHVCLRRPTYRDGGAGGGRRAVI